MRLSRRFGESGDHLSARQCTVAHMANEQDFVWIHHYAPDVAAELTDYSSEQVVEALAVLAPYVAEQCGLAGVNSDQLGVRANLAAWVDAVTSYLDVRADNDDAEVEDEDWAERIDLAAFTYPDWAATPVTGKGQGRLVAVPAHTYGEALAALVTAEHLLGLWHQPTLFDTSEPGVGGASSDQPASKTEALRDQLRAVHRELYQARSAVEYTPVNQLSSMFVALPMRTIEQAAAMLTQFQDTKIAEGLAERSVLTSAAGAAVLAACSAADAALSAALQGAQLQHTY